MAKNFSNAAFFDLRDIHLFFLRSDPAVFGALLVTFYRVRKQSSENHRNKPRLVCSM